MPHRAPHGARRPALQLAAMLSFGSALFASATMVGTSAVAPWPEVVEASTANVGVTVTGIVVGVAAGTGVFIAAPIAAAYEIWGGRRRAFAFSVVQCSMSVAGLLSGVWLAAIPAAFGGAVLVLLLLPRSRSAMRPSTGSEGRWSASVGYVLLVSGGLWGLHNFYLRRAWAGVLCIGLLIFGAGTWGGLASYLCFGSLGVLLGIDALSMPERVRRLVRKGTDVRWGRARW